MNHPAGKKPSVLSTYLGTRTTNNCPTFPNKKEPPNRHRNQQLSGPESSLHPPSSYLPNQPKHSHLKRTYPIQKLPSKPIDRSPRFRQPKLNDVAGSALLQLLPKKTSAVSVPGHLSATPAETPTYRIGKVCCEKCRARQGFGSRMRASRGPY